MNLAKGPFPLHSQFAIRMRFPNCELQTDANPIHTQILFARIFIVSRANEICFDHMAGRHQIFGAIFLVLIIFRPEMAATNRRRLLVLLLLRRRIH